LSEARYCSPVSKTSRASSDRSVRNEIRSTPRTYNRTYATVTELSAINDFVLGDERWVRLTLMELPPGVAWQQASAEMAQAAQPPKLHAASPCKV
jgi:hypothetical protein